MATKSGSRTRADSPWIARNRASQRSRRASSRNSTSSVLSPARVPSCSSIVEFVDGLGEHAGRARRADQQQDEAAAADAHGDVADDPAEMLVAGRWSGRNGEVGRRDVDVAIAARDLDEAELGDVAADRRLRHGIAAVAQLLDELVLAADRLAGDELADQALAFGLAERGSWRWRCRCRRRGRAVVGARSGCTRGSRETGAGARTSAASRRSGR